MSHNILMGSFAGGLPILLQRSWFKVQWNSYVGMYVYEYKYSFPPSLPQWNSFKKYILTMCLNFLIVKR